METALLKEYNSDPEFRVCKLPSWRARLYQFLSVGVWGQFPGGVQRRLSAAYASHFTKPYSKWLIKPYTRMVYRQRDYLEKFKPPYGKSHFENFQDFFIREFKTLPQNTSEVVWPCEGLVCDQDIVGHLKQVRVKCDVRTLATIFGKEEGEIPDHYSFSNIFLHNKNYHRIHAPVAGQITRIQHIPGDLLVLRPWIYRQNPSLPAFRNERYNIDITDNRGMVWYMSVVGGPAVGSIGLPEGIHLGASIAKLQELAVFYLGSTCCLAAPKAPAASRLNSFVEVGATY